MNVIVISESLIIRKGIISILSNEKIVENIRESKHYKDMYQLSNDLIVIDINKQNIKCLNDLMVLKYKYNIKSIVLDFYEQRSIFSECIKLNIDGYILGNIDSENLALAVKQIHNGKKYYNNRLIEESGFKNNYRDIELLTKREKETFNLIARGKSNLEISNELYITEYTVKKHVSNILSKLDLNDRVQIALYAYNNGILEN